jgi:hypothetical protein
LTLSNPQTTPPAAQRPARKLSGGAIAAIVIGVVVVVLCGICTLGAIVRGALDDDSSAATATDPTGATTPRLDANSTAPAPTTIAATTISATTLSPTTAAIPKGLVGTNALIAHDQLKALGFTNIHYASADEYDTVVILAQNWTVTKVEPAPGTVLALDATIVLTCTKKK